MSAQVLLLAGDKNLKNSMKNMKLLEEEERLSRLDGYGARSLSPRTKQVHPICSTRIPATESLTNKTLVQSKVLISVLR